MKRLVLISAAALALAAPAAASVNSVLPVGGGQPTCTAWQRGAVYGPAWQTAWNAASGGYPSYGYGYSYCTGTRWVWE